MSQMCKVMTPLKEEKGTRRDVVGGVGLQSHCSTDDAAFLFPITRQVFSSISSDCVALKPFFKTNSEQQNQSQLVCWRQ